MTSSLIQNTTQKIMDLKEVPTMTSNQKPKTPEHDPQSNLYACFNPAALSLLAPQLLANQTAAAAALMAAWPMQLRAQLASSIGLQTTSPFFPPGWPMTPPLSHKSATNSPPPMSPISPIQSSKKSKIHNNNNNYTNMNNNHIVVSTTTSDLVSKKGHKRKVVEDKSDHTVPVSPPTPTSSSSPQSNNSADFATSTRDPSKDKVFTCKICNRSFGYKHVLQNHERTHTGEKPFECPECHKRFTRDHHLKTHMRLHTGEKPYSCSHCDRQFVQVANLRRHLRVHTGERPYTCEVCEAKFSDSNQLKAHILIHNGERPFECEKCNVKFRRRHHLMHHKCGSASSVSDNKSKQSDEESLEYKLMNSEVPLNLNSTDGRLMSNFIRKFNESRMFQLPQINFMQTEMPEQTEPEDLSFTKNFHSPKSPVSMDELDDLEDAATLYAKLQNKKIKIEKN